VAALFHDIAKGRGGDHSILGAEVVDRLGPRLGLTPAEVETASWLVRHHLLMSRTAFKRDLSDFKTILDFASVVQSPERLRLLLVLTVVDIRAVGPSVWNGWKRQLLRELYEGAEEVLRLGHKQRGRVERIAAKQALLRDTLGWDEERLAAYVRRLPEAYWIAEPDEVIAHNARFMAKAEGADLAIDAQVHPERGATLVTVVAADHPGLFYRIAGAIHLAGGNIIDARIHTTSSRTRSAGRSTRRANSPASAPGSRTRSPIVGGWPTGSRPSPPPARAPTPSRSRPTCCSTTAPPTASPLSRSTPATAPPC
jgi:[protein-PII] uridylyltransferase